VFVPFLLTALAFSVFNRGTTLEVDKRVFLSVALVSLALVLPAVVIYSRRQRDDGCAVLSKVPAYRMTGSWAFVVALRCLLIGGAAVLCGYLWLRMIGERIDGEINETKVRIAKLSTAGNPKGGCNLHATFSSARGEIEICAWHAWQEALLPADAAEGQLALLTIKRNAVSSSVVAARIVE